MLISQRPNCKFPTANPLDTLLQTTKETPTPRPFLFDKYERRYGRRTPFTPFWRQSQICLSGVVRDRKSPYSFSPCHGRLERQPFRDNLYPTGFV